MICNISYKAYVIWSIIKKKKKNSTTEDVEIVFYFCTRWHQKSPIPIKNAKQSLNAAMKDQRILKRTEVHFSHIYVSWNYCHRVSFFQYFKLFIFLTAISCDLCGKFMRMACKFCQHQSIICASSFIFTDIGWFMWKFKGKAWNLHSMVENTI